MGWIVSVILFIIALVVTWRQRQQHDAELKKQRTASTKALEHARQEHEQQLKRLQRETDQTKAQGHLKLVKDLLPGMDALFEAERLANTEDLSCPPELAKGLSMVTNEFERALNRHGVTKMHPQQGDAFDPAIHEAVAMIEDPSFDSNSIAASMRSGWQHDTRVLRPAMVQVNKHNATQGADDVTFDFNEDEETSAEERAQEHAEHVVTSSS